MFLLQQNKKRRRPGATCHAEADFFIFIFRETSGRSDDDGDKYKGRYDYEEVDTIMIKISTGMAKKNGTARAKRQ